MMAKRLTYGQLAERLRSLGFADIKRTVGRKSAWLFEHPLNEKTTIFLPVVSLNQTVEPMHMTGVRAALQAHGILLDPQEIWSFANGVNSVAEGDG